MSRVTEASAQSSTHVHAIRWASGIGGANTPSVMICIRADGCRRVSRYIVGRTTATGTSERRTMVSIIALPTKLGSSQGGGLLALESFSTTDSRPHEVVADNAFSTCVRKASCD